MILDTASKECNAEEKKSWCSFSTPVHTINMKLHAKVHLVSYAPSLSVLFISSFCCIKIISMHFLMLQFCYLYRLFVHIFECKKNVFMRYLFVVLSYKEFHKNNNNNNNISQSSKERLYKMNVSAFRVHFPPNFFSLFLCRLLYL